MLPADRPQKLLLPLGAATLLFLGLVSPWIAAGAPWDPDESRYLEIGREMARSSDWVVPCLNEVPYLEKPPLYIWMLAGAFRVFGPSALAGRLVSLLSAAGVVLLTAWIGCQVGGRRLGVRSALVLAACPLFIVMASLVTLDMTFTLWVTAASACAIHGLGRPEEDRRGRRTALLLGYLFLGLGFLTKGPVALVIPAAVWLALRRGAGMKSWMPPHPLVGSLIFLAVVLPWYVAVTMRYPGFPEFFFIRGHVSRLLGNNVPHVNFHEQPFYFYVPILFGGAFPWILFLPAPWTRLKRELSRGEASRPMWSWLLLGLAFFSLVSGKLPTYILPLFPVVAVLAARRWEEIASGELPRAWRIGLASTVPAAAFIAALVVGLLLASDRIENLALFDRRLIAGVVALAAALSLGGLLLVFRARSRPAFAAIFSLAFLTSGFGPLLKAPLDRQRSVETLALALRAAVGEEDIVASWGRYFPLISFHLGRSALVGGSRRELAYGSEELGARPDLFFEEEEIERLAGGPRRLFLTIPERKWERLRPGVGELALLGRFGSYLLLSNRSLPWPHQGVVGAGSD